MLPQSDNVSIKPELNWLHYISVTEVIARLMTYDFEYDIPLIQSRMAPLYFFFNTMAASWKLHICWEVTLFSYPWKIWGNKSIFERPRSVSLLREVTLLVLTWNRTTVSLQTSSLSRCDATAAALCCEGLQEGSVKDQANWTHSRTCGGMKMWQSMSGFEATPHFTETHVHADTVTPMGGWIQATAVTAGPGFVSKLGPF